MSKKSIKNYVLATIYTIVGFIGALAAEFFAGCLYYLNFLPVKIAGTIVWGNRILRYELYFLCVVTFFGMLWLCDYGSTFLTKKLLKQRKNHQKSKRR